MSRTATIEPEIATGEAKELLTAVKAKLGIVPNMTRAMAVSPAVLEGYLSLSGALGRGTLSAKCGKRIALAVAEANGCDYCLAIHSATAGSVGLDEAEILANRRGRSADPHADAVLRFVRDVLASRGHVSDEELQTARASGVTDAEIAEAVAHVAVNVFTNYFNTVAGTDLDFPRAEPLSVA